MALRAAPKGRKRTVSFTALIRVIARISAHEAGGHLRRALPHVLRPPDWPGDALRVLIGRIAAADGPAEAAHIAHRCDTAM
jgi:hypothetical protein